MAAAAAASQYRWPVVCGQCPVPEASGRYLWLPATGLWLPATGLWYRPQVPAVAGIWSLPIVVISLLFKYFHYLNWTYPFQSVRGHWTRTLCQCRLRTNTVLGVPRVCIFTAGCYCVEWTEPQSSCLHTTAHDSSFQNERCAGLHSPCCFTSSLTLQWMVPPTNLTPSHSAVEQP